MFFLYVSSHLRIRFRIFQNKIKNPRDHVHQHSAPLLAELMIMYGTVAGSYGGRFVPPAQRHRDVIVTSPYVINVINLSNVRYISALLFCYQTFLPKFHGVHRLLPGQPI
jgi:hypothetical protein